MTSHHVRQHQQLVRLLLVLLAVVAASSDAGAQVNMAALESRVVRVVVGDRPGEQYAASGFLWVNQRQVVTSLHTFSYRTTDPPKIVVTCRGAGGPQISGASVTRVLRDADLVLLTTDQVLDGCNVFTPTHVQSEKPADFSSLYTFGFHAGAQGGTSRKFEKGRANPELLDSLLYEPVRGAVLKGGVPRLDLPIYYVQHGLLPGYSGAPVIDAANRLVGVVEGGLDKGASSYNWLIPATNLSRLEVSRDTLPARGFIAGAAYFSSPVVGNASTLRLAREGQPNKAEYEFVNTKRRSLGQIISTSESPQAFEAFLKSAAEMGLSRSAVANLQFDLYEDVRKDLVIAIPTGQQMVSVPPQTPGQVAVLRARATDPREGQLLFYEVPTPTFVPPNVKQIPQIQSAAFLKMVVDHQVQRCSPEYRFRHTCQLIDSDTTPFPNGGALLTFSVLVRAERPQPDIIQVITLAVQGRTTFFAGVSITPVEANMTVPQFANMLAVGITTFGGTAGEGQSSGGRSSSTLAANGTTGANPPRWRGTTASGSLKEGEEVTLTLPRLQVGKEYTISGECDLDCDDLDLEVSRDGKVIESDEEDDDFPMVNYTPAPGGPYQVTISMPSCDADACEWTLTIEGT